MNGPLIGEKDFQLPLDKEVSSRRSEGVPREKKSILCFGEKKKRRIEV
jgi:hypothetical protein